MIVRRALIFFVVLSALLPARAPWAADPAPAPVSAKQRAAEIVVAIKEYRASLETLLPLREQQVLGALKQRDQRRELLERGIISRKEFEQIEAAAARAEEQLVETRRAIIAADHMLAEATTARALAGQSPLRPGGYERSADLIRYNGTAAWSLAVDTPKLQKFFAARFGRPLPVSSYGQTPLHDRMGLDHRDALDVAVHPDSPEGQALMDHLRAAGIPFIVSWGPVPGSASGAHIHVGQPSPRIAVKR